MSHWTFRNLKQNRRVKVLLGMLLTTLSVFVVAYFIDRALG